jgi:hypothetical protein
LITAQEVTGLNPVEVTIRIRIKDNPFKRLTKLLKAIN